MYAIIESGGKQFKIKKKELITVEKINKNIGKTIKLNIIMIFKKNKKIIIGKKLDNYCIIGKIKKHIKNKKIKIIKFKRRKNYLRTKGHRQKLTMLEIKSINKIN